MSKPIILCVDDEDIILQAIKDQLLRKFGNEYSIETSDSGDDALEFFEELLEDDETVPLVIADYIMPGMKGDELLKNIHKLSPDTLTILLTGQASLEGVTNAVNNASLYRYIGKPWDEDDLAITVREAIKSFYQEREILQKNEELAELNTSLEKKVEQRTIELKELNATKDKFFSIIAHDLKNPFNALMGLGTLLIDDYDSFENEERKDLIGTMYEASENAYKLLQNLLEWSRTQTGRIKFNPDTINVKQLADDTIQLLTNQAANKNIALTAVMSPKMEAFADPNMIKTVIRNLMSNSIKYTPNGGQVNILGRKHEGMIELTIEDNGVGISKEDQNKLFRIDVNHSTSGTANEQGTGLGLILCKEFIEKNGGKIWVESEEGKGSSFIFTLPEKPSK